MRGPERLLGLPQIGDGDILVTRNHVLKIAHAGTNRNIQP
jgi:hypothetical protein